MHPTPSQGFVNFIMPLVCQALEPHIPEIWSEANAVRTQSSARLRAQRHSSDGGSVGGSRHRSLDGCLGFRDRRGAALLGAAAAHLDRPRAPAPANEHLTVARRAVSFGGAPRPMMSMLAPRGAAPSVGSADHARQLATNSSSNLSDSDAAADDGLVVLGPRPASHLASCSGKRLCTGAMLQVVEQEIIRSKRLSLDVGCGADGASAELVAPGGELVLSELIGAGGFGSVWRGSWKNITAAIKVMYERGTEQEAMMDAVEMAVLSTVSHPNIIQVYTCLTDMVEVGGSPGAYANLLALLTCLLKAARFEVEPTSVLTQSPPSNPPLPRSRQEL
jgi:hypothetical protein